MDVNYQELLERKIKKVQQSGFKIKESQLNKHLFDFQKHIVKRAIKQGRFAIFADCGLGKTLMQLDWAYQVAHKTKKRVLILAPLAVKGQTLQESIKFGVDMSLIDINNYEQLDNIDISIYSGIVLDESSILKNFTGKTKKLIIDKFNKTPYKLACTATPSPNDLNEIGNHSEFLNILDAQDMRAKWFVRDEGMNNYRLKGHAKNDFYGWISSWAIMLTNPKDLGFDGKDYVLPELKYIEKTIKTNERDNGELFNNSSVSATEFNKELRLSIVERFDEVANIVNNSKETFIIWVNQNIEEKRALELIPDAVSVNGSEKPEIKEKKLLGFANGDFRVLVTKKKIAQFGMNFQNCNNQVFASLDFSFEGLYQAIRRSYRFGQKNKVNIYIITTDTMQNVIQSINNKQSQFEEMQNEMNKFINGSSFGLLDSYDFKEEKNNNYWLMKGDSCQEIKRIPDNSVDLIVFSPP